MVGAGGLLKEGMSRSWGKYQEQGKGWAAIGDNQRLKGLGETGRRELKLMVEERTARC